MHFFKTRHSRKIFIVTSSLPGLLQIYMLHKGIWVGECGGGGVIGRWIRNETILLWHLYAIHLSGHFQALPTCDQNPLVIKYTSMYLLQTENWFALPPCCRWSHTLTVPLSGQNAVKTNIFSKQN